MIRLADCYIADPSPPRIRILEDLMRLILGGRGQKEGVGLTGYGIIVIDTDGTLTKNDTLKVAHDGADRFPQAHTITELDLEGFLGTDDVSSYYSLQVPTSATCRRCPEMTVGGNATHTAGPRRTAMTTRQCSAPIRWRSSGICAAGWCRPLRRRGRRKSESGPQCRKRIADFTWPRRSVLLGAPFGTSVHRRTTASISRVGRFLESRSVTRRLKGVYRLRRLRQS